MIFDKKGFMLIDSLLLLLIIIIVVTIVSIQVNGYYHGYFYQK